MFEVDRRDRHQVTANYVSQRNSRKGASLWGRFHKTLEGSHRGERGLRPISCEHKVLIRLVEHKALIRLVKTTCEDLSRKAAIGGDEAILERAGAVASSWAD